jgi:hypothetical protein
MALAAKPTISIVFSFRDDDGKNSTTEFTIPGSTTAANALAFAAAVRLLIAALTDSTLTGYNVILGFVEAGALVIGSSDVENKGLFLLKAANAGQSTITVPSPLESILQLNNQDIDHANTDVEAFEDALTLGIAGVQPCSASGSDYTTIYDAYKQNRRSHLNGRQRKG